MGFSDHTIHNISLVPESYASSRNYNNNKDDPNTAGTSCAAAANDDSTMLPDQEILESTEAIYFSETAETGLYEIRVSFQSTTSSE